MSDYKGLPLSPEKMESMLLELYSGKRFRRRDAIELVKVEFQKRGGVVRDGYDLVSCFKKAVSNIKGKGLIGNPAFGYWDIYDSPDKREVDVEIKNVKEETPTPRRLHDPGCKHIGDGTGEVYVYYYPSYKELAELKGELVYPCKIGMTVVGSADRISSQGRTNMPEFPVVDLVLHTDQPELAEKTIHDVLRLNGCLIQDSPGDEWYLTNPNRVMIICMRLGLAEGNYETTM